MAEQGENQPAEGAKRKLPIKTIIVLAAVLLIEGAAVSLVFLLAGQPADVKAEGAKLEKADLNQPTEMLLVEDRFQNTRTGRAYLYDTEIYMVVPKKHKPTVKDKLEQMKAQVTTEIATIFRRAEPAHLLEPELSTLTRQIKAMVDRKFGYDEEGEAYVQQVLIRKCMQFRAN